MKSFHLAIDLTSFRNEINKRVSNSISRKKFLHQNFDIYIYFFSDFEA